MLRYKPNFCCNCGEKIERLDWPFWSGRRFCELCETDYWLYDATPLLAAGVIALLGVLGFAGLFRAENRVDVQATRREVGAAATLPSPQAGSKPSDPVTQSAVSPTSQLQGPATAPLPDTSKANEKPVKQAVFTCGAMTKKGTACTRRVKIAGERCWQHRGMPAMEAGNRP
jgi:hypothetical protein